MPPGEMIGNGRLMPMPTMGSPIPNGAPPMGMPPGGGLMPLPNGGAVTNGMPPAPFGSPTVDSSVFGGNTDASDYERQLRERAIQERNKQILQQEEMRRRGELINTPMEYRDPTTGNVGVNLDVRADDDGIERLGGGLTYKDGAQQLNVGGAYYPGYQMDGIGRVDGIGRAEINYQTPNFSVTGEYTRGRRGMRGGFGGAANFRGQF